MVKGLYSLSGRAAYGTISKPRDSALKFSNRSEISQAASEVFQRYTVIITLNLVESSLREIWQQDRRLTA